MKEYNILVIYLHNCHKNNIILVFVLNLRILPGMSQPPNPAIPFRMETQRPLVLMVSQVDWRSMLSATPMIIYHVNEYFKCKVKYF